MWLCNTTSLQLEYINSSEERVYAILSHTWEDGEVTFQDMASLDQARLKKGFSKIEWTCRLARQRGIDYAWVDTCCIDKANAVELAESINSMFKWYKDSGVCFVYLSDLAPSSSINSWGPDFQHCRWFTRGWTLQELIAPDIVEFYDRDWIFRGDKSSSRSILCDITAIDIKVLADSERITTVPVARRMSWASTRKTTRIEDIAYCLFGIFDVNLPLIYGEGRKAFIRLQEEIIRETYDLTMFAWTSGHGDQRFRGIFAHSPYEFRNCRDLVMLNDPALQTTDFEMTNRGVKFTSSLLVSKGKEKDYSLLNLNCQHSSALQHDEVHGAILIPLVRIRSGYVRCSSRTLAIGSLLPLRTPEQEAAMWLHKNITQVTVPKTLTRATSDLIAFQRAHRFSIRIKNSTKWQINTQQFNPEQLWDPSSNSFGTEGQGGFTAAVDIFLRGQTYISEWDPTTGKILALGLAKPVQKDQQTAAEYMSYEPEPLEPWAAIYPKHRTNIGRTNISISSVGITIGLTPQDHARASRFRARRKQRPSTLVLTHPYIQQSRSIITKARSYSKEHSLQLSVSTNVFVDRDAGMYELVLSIREDGNTEGPIRFGIEPPVFSIQALQSNESPTANIPIRSTKKIKRRTSSQKGWLSGLLWIWNRFAAIFNPKARRSIDIQTRQPLLPRPR